VHLKTLDGLMSGQHSQSQILNNPQRRQFEIHIWKKN
jgi:hypothetical protein